MTPALIVRAIEETARNNGRSWRYVETILKSAQKQNIRTVEAYETAQAEWRRKKEKEQDRKKSTGWNAKHGDGKGLLKKAIERSTEL